MPCSAQASYGGRAALVCYVCTYIYIYICRYISLASYLSIYMYVCLGRWHCMGMHMHGCIQCACAQTHTHNHNRTVAQHSHIVLALSPPPRARTHTHKTRSCSHGHAVLCTMVLSLNTMLLVCTACLVCPHGFLNRFAEVVKPGSCVVHSTESTNEPKTCHSKRLHMRTTRMKEATQAVKDAS